MRNVEDLWRLGRRLFEFEVALGDISLSIFAMVKPWIQHVALDHTCCRGSELASAECSLKIFNRLHECRLYEDFSKFTSKEQWCVQGCQLLWRPQLWTWSSTLAIPFPITPWTASSKSEGYVSMSFAHRILCFQMKPYHHPLFGNIVMWQPPCSMSIWSWT